MMVRHADAGGEYREISEMLITWIVVEMMDDLTKLQLLTYGLFYYCSQHLERFLSPG